MLGIISLLFGPKQRNTSVLGKVPDTAVITLREFQKLLLQTGIQVWFARVKTHVLDVMERGGLEEAIPSEHFYPSVQTAVDAFLAEEQDS